ncbi:MAG: AMP-binding protein [Oceanihabitans sp.]
MAPHFSKIHYRFKINNNSFSYNELKDFAYSYVKEGVDYQKELGDFLLDWLNKKDFILATTSGSTGIPKIVKLQKQAMVHSAIATGDFFNLKPGDTALHCLPSKYIAGKMMLVRALILGLELDLVKPSLQPDFNFKKEYHFCAMIPLQLQNILTNSSKIKTIIVGGSSVSKPLQEKISHLKVNVYETYGMTETITHIAVKKLNNFNAAIGTNLYFKTLPNINISQDTRGCLVIDAPNLLKEKITTNDVVKLQSKKSFLWLGRIDNVINSGGVKLFPEQIEAKLQHKISERFIIAKELDATYGERVILILEKLTNSINSSVFNVLEKIEIPKKIYAVEKFAESKNGKILRQEILKSLKE